MTLAYYIAGIICVFLIGFFLGDSFAYPRIIKSGRAIPKNDADKHREAGYKQGYKIGYSNGIDDVLLKINTLKEGKDGREEQSCTLPNSNV